MIALQQSFAEDGDFVVALFNEELLIRKLCMSEKYTTLLAQNPRFMTIEISPRVSFRILGKEVARRILVRKKRFV